MFCLFFTAGPVTESGRARSAAIIEKFARFFNHCLDAGVYFAPSQFETGFISTAHQPAQIDDDRPDRARGDWRSFLVRRTGRAKVLRPFALCTRKRSS